MSVHKDINIKDHWAPDLLIRILFLTLISASSNSTTAMGKIILHVEGKNLPKMDLLSKSDPYLCVFIGKKKIIIATDYLQSTFYHSHSKQKLITDY